MSALTHYLNELDFFFLNALEKLLYEYQFGSGYKAQLDEYGTEAQHENDGYVLKVGFEDVTVNEDVHVLVEGVLP